MSLLLLGYFLLLSFTEGSNTAFTCSPGRLTATCDADRVILIRRVFRGYYGGAFDGSHCKYQVGDGFETDDRDSKEVWKDCNLQTTCSFPFLQSDNYYLEMHYECDIDIRPVTLSAAVPLIIFVIIIILYGKVCDARVCKCHSSSGEITDDAAQNNERVIPNMPVYENYGLHASESPFVNRAFVGDQNPSVYQISDTVNPSDVYVPDKLATPTENYNQRMPTYENVEPKRRSQVASVLETDTQHLEAAASTDGDGPPYAEIGDNGPRMSSLGAAVASLEKVESPYAKLDSVERSEYLDLRQIGFPGATAADVEEAESSYAQLDPVERSEYLDLRHLPRPQAMECTKF